MVFKMFDEEFGLFRCILMYPVQFLLKIEGFLIGLFANETIIDLIFTEQFFDFFLVEIMFLLS